MINIEEQHLEDSIVKFLHYVKKVGCSEISGVATEDSYFIRMKGGESFICGEEGTLSECVSGFVVALLAYSNEMKIGVSVCKKGHGTKKKFAVHVTYDERCFKH